MTVLPAVVLSVLAATGACPVACSPGSSPLPEVADAEEEIVAGSPVADLEAQAEGASGLLEEQVPLDPLGVLDELAATRLPTGDASRLQTREPTVPSEAAVATEGGEEDAVPDREPEPVAENHVVREPTAPRAQGEAGHAAPAWPQAQGEPVVQHPANALVSLLLGLAAVGLYHKLSKDRAVEHPARQRILAMLAEEPGLGTTDVADELDVAYRTARHHLEVLARFDLVVRVDRRGRWRWARPENADQASQCQVPALQRRLLAVLEEEPGLHLSELARRLDEAKATVKHHLDRLDEREAVRDERVGPLRRFFPVEDEQRASR